MSVNAEVKSKVYNFKMYNLQQSLKKIYLKQETLAAPCKWKGLGSREQWPSYPLKGKAGLHTGTPLFPWHPPPFSTGQTCGCFCSEGT